MRWLSKQDHKTRQLIQECVISLIQELTRSLVLRLEAIAELADGELAPRQLAQAAASFVEASLAIEADPMAGRGADALN